MNRLMVNVRVADRDVLELYEGKLLQPSTPASAAVDLRAMFDGYVAPGSTEIVCTGLFIEPKDERYCALLLPRSGLACKGITLGNSPGLIDNDYRGEIKLILRNENDRILDTSNQSDSSFRWKKGDRLAQLMFVQFGVPLVTVVDGLGNTLRGEGGLGSTGR